MVGGVAEGVGWGVVGGTYGKVCMARGVACGVFGGVL